MEARPTYAFQVLTKRPERARKWNDVLGAQARPWPDNVWLGTSVEDQLRADERIPHLLSVDAPVRFVSCEPLLGPVDLRWIQTPVVEINALTGDHGVHRPHRGRSDRRVHWVIVGGETGPRAREMNPLWALQLYQQCVQFEVPFFFKQWTNRKQPWDLHPHFQQVAATRQFPEGTPGR
jgi:protein gp37